MTQLVALRPEVVLRASEGETAAVLVDDLLGRTVALDAELELVAMALDGRGTIEQIVATVTSLGLSRDIAVKNLRALILLNVVEGTDERAVPRLRALRSGEATLDAAALPETRHACQGSGGCCRNYRVGPLTDADVARIDGLGAEHGLPGGHEGAWYVTSELEGHPTRFMQTRGDGSCVFLDDQRRCGLHGRFGASAKPRACSRYPIDLVLRYDGVHLFDRGGCDSYAVAIRQGLPVIRDQARLQPFTEESPRLTHPLLVIPGGALVDWSFVHPVVELTMRDISRRQGSAPEALRALIRRLVTLGAELAGPPQLDLTRRALAAVCDASSADPWAPTAPQAITVGARATAVLFQELELAAGELLADPKAPAFARRQAEGARSVMEVVAEAAARLAAPGARVSPEAARALATSVDSPDLDAALRYDLRQELFGQGVTLKARAQTSLLRLACGQLVSLYGARLAAAARGAASASAEDFGPAHALANRLLGLDRFVEVMNRHAAQCRAILESLPTLARWR